MAHLSFWTTMKVIWEYRWTLLGTASCWFLIDVTFYGQVSLPLKAKLPA